MILRLKLLKVLMVYLKIKNLASMSRDIILRMSKDEFEAFFAMAEENAISIGGSGDGDDDPFGDINTERVKIINKMLRYNRRKEQIVY